MSIDVGQLEAITLKRSERIVDVILNSLGGDESKAFHAEARAELVDKVQRILCPQFRDYKDNFSSSNILGLSYDDEAHVLQVDFKGGGRYHYHGVEPEKADALLESESKGKYLNQHVKRVYPYERVR